MSRPTAVRALFCALLLTAVCLPATASARIGPDYVSSDNIELVNRIKTVGDGVGARIIGDYLYVTSTKSLDIFDIKTDPENPKQVGLETLDVEFENEEVPTNGKLLGISGQDGCADPLVPLMAATPGIGCLTLWDVSNPANVTKITSVGGAGNHTSTCVYDCRWFMGSAGTVTDASDPAHAKIIGNWESGLAEGYFKSSCHHLREIQPGIVLGSCQPIVLMSIRPEDGADVLHPKVLDTGVNQDDRFIHSSRWPNGGTDKFLLAGGETNASPTCDDTVGAFMVWDATAVLDGKGFFTPGQQFKLLDEVRPVNGSYVDGHTPYNGLGCSVHWFEEHPSFKNGGLVALAEYENGERMLQITPQGKIVEQGYFLPLGGSTSAPHWNPNGKVIYSIDYGRGVDVLRYTGDTYVPAGGAVTPTPGATPGTNGPTATPPCAAAAGFESVSAKPAGSGLRFQSKVRTQKSYRVDVLQESIRRRVLHDSLRARFSGKTKGFAWNGRGTGGGRLADGYYAARFTMELGPKFHDVRRVALRRSHGRFTSAPAWFQAAPCGIFPQFELSGPVFGGVTGAPLGIKVRTARGATSLRVEVRRGARLIKAFTKTGPQAGTTYSFSLPAGAVPRGSQVAVRAILGGETPQGEKALVAHRL